MINVRITDKNGPVVALRAVTDSDSLMLITAKGTLLRMDLSGLRDIGRATQGVKLIRVDDEDRVVAVAKLVADKDENGGEAGGATPTGDANPGTPPAEDGPSTGDGANESGPQ